MENSSEFYYEKLKTGEKSGAVLASFFCSLYDKPLTKSEIIMFNRLVKVFSKFTVFFAVLDVAGSYPELEGNVYPLLFTICKRRFETAHPDSTLQSRESLDGFIANIEKEIERLGKKKIGIPPPKGLEKDG